MELFVRNLQDSLAQQVLDRANEIRMGRRTFLKFAGLGTAAVALSACDKSQEIPGLAELQALPDVSLDMLTGKINFPKREGIFNTLPIVQTCNIDTQAFTNLEVIDRYIQIEEMCEGHLQQGDANGITTLLTNTLPGVRINGQLVADLAEGIRRTGYTEGLQQVEYNSILLHRVDGEDGLPGGNVVDFNENAMTAIAPNTSIAFSSIPLEGDLIGDIRALATEMCQAAILANPDNMQAETLCNAFGTAASTAWLGWTYENYATLMHGTGYKLMDGRTGFFEPIPEGAYYFLRDHLQSQPDIFEIK